jgi:hypothetical protein
VHLHLHLLLHGRQHARPRHGLSLLLLLLLLHVADGHGLLAGDEGLLVLVQPSSRGAHTRAS